MYAPAAGSYPGIKNIPAFSLWSNTFPDVRTLLQTRGNSVLKRSGRKIPGKSF